MVGYMARYRSTKPDIAVPLRGGQKQWTERSIGLLTSREYSISNQNLIRPTSRSTRSRKLNLP